MSDYLQNCFTCHKLGACSLTDPQKVLNDWVCTLYRDAIHPVILARGEMVNQYGPVAAVRALLNRPAEFKEESLVMSLMELPPNGTPYSDRKKEFEKHAFTDVRILGTKRYKNPDGSPVLDWDETMHVDSRDKSIQKVLAFELANGIIVPDAAVQSQPQGEVSMAGQFVPPGMPGAQSFGPPGVMVPPPPPQQPMPQMMPIPPGPPQQMMMPPGQMMMPPGAMPPPPASAAQAAGEPQQQQGGKKKRQGAGAAVAPPPPPPPPMPNGAMQPGMPQGMMPPPPQQMMAPPQMAPAPMMAPMPGQMTAMPQAAPMQPQAAQVDLTPIHQQVDQVGKAVNAAGTANQEAIGELKMLLAINLVCLQHIYLGQQHLQPAIGAATQAGVNMQDFSKFLEYMKQYLPK